MRNNNTPAFTQEIKGNTFDSNYTPFDVPVTQKNGAQNPFGEKADEQ